MRRYYFFICCLFMALTISAQTSLINNLKRKHGDLQKQIANTEQMLKSTKKDVQGQLHHIQALNGQIEERQRYIETVNNDVQTINGQVVSLSARLQAMERDLNLKKRQYLTSVNYLYRNKSIQEKLMFIFSAKSLEQAYRRMRYIKEYAAYQRLQGEEIKRRQALVNSHRHQLVQVKQVKVGMVKEGENEKAVLQQKQQEKQTAVIELQKKQKGLQSVLAKKRREATQLNSRIDRLISLEIEKARRRAEAEARKRREAEKRRLAQEAARQKAAEEAERRREEAAAKAEEEKARQLAAREAKNNNGSKNNPAKTTPAPIRVKPHKEVVRVVPKPEPVEDMSVSTTDQRLSNTFENNRGRLSMPITGSYIIVSHYGQYAVEGMHNVKLDNKGIDIQGTPGACARAVYDGEVSAVFQMNGLVNILVRHGEYISVYCNLASASVHQGQQVSSRQTLGRVFSDSSDGNRTVLHFQLRKERAKLNPEQWLRR